MVYQGPERSKPWKALVLVLIVGSLAAWWIAYFLALRVRAFIAFRVSFVAQPMKLTRVSPCAPPALEWLTRLMGEPDMVSLTRL